MTVRIGSSPTGVKLEVRRGHDDHHAWTAKKYAVTFHGDHFVFTPSEHRSVKSEALPTFKLTQLPSKSLVLTATSIKVIDPWAATAGFDYPYFAIGHASRVVNYEGTGVISVYLPEPMKALRPNPSEKRNGSVAPLGKSRDELLAFDTKEQMEKHSSKFPRVKMIKEPAKLGSAQPAETPTLDPGTYTIQLNHEGKIDWSTARPVVACRTGQPGDPMFPTSPGNLKDDSIYPRIIKKVNTDYEMTISKKALIEMIHRTNTLSPIPSTADIFIRVPGGGDWSGCNLDLIDAPITVKWSAQE